MIKLKYKGEFYNCGVFIATHGEEVEVSPEKANQLLTDFPKDWEKVSEDKKAQIKDKK